MDTQTNTSPTPTTPPPPPPAAAAPAAPVAPPRPAVYPDGKPAVDAYGRPVSPKSRLAALLLAFFVGIFGVHRFYAGKVGTGVLQLVTLGGLGIWAFIDFITIAAGSFKDSDGMRIGNW